MTENPLPLIVDCEILQQHLADPDLLIVDLGKSETYRLYHIPGAVHLETAHIVAQRTPVRGLLPDDRALETVFSSVGLTPDTHVVACDSEGGGWAGRLLWTLEAVGHRRVSMLNGGLPAWSNRGYPLSSEPTEVTPGEYRITQRNAGVIADSQYILEHLQDVDVQLLDARSAAEYSGEKKFAERGGHIPGAVNLDWLRCINRADNLCLHPPERLQQLLDARHINRKSETIVYCQTHHRSALLYVVLKSLGYDKVRGYPGSWSDWGNNTALPVET
jgi:thiosulfate/3-mercaptopyruvate sulfurtransferase